MPNILEDVVKNGNLDLEGVLIRSIMRPINALKNRVDTLASKLDEIYSKAQEMPLQGIQGEKGDKGADGVNGKDGINGKDGVNGKNGEVGKTGKDGKDGIDGKSGISVIDASVDFDNHLIITLSDGNIIDAGVINVESKTQYVTQVKGEEVVSYSTRYDQISTTLAYKGEAIVGASESAPLWRIQKLVYGTDGDVTITWANGSADFRNSWTEKATLIYS